MGTGVQLYGRFSRTKNIFKTSKLANFQIGFFTLNCVLIVSSFLYVPIVISIKKLSNLRVVQETQPQKYIIWQAMITMMVKSISLPVAALYLYYDNQYEIDITLVILFLIITDIILLPLIIQISYLSCNKRNVEAFFHILFCRNLCKSAVEPDIVESSDSV
ncbi:hypothetical protein B9Z55_012036 [Caenorhabditis nigoni]|uniref:Serpentine receptor class gamma n=1 Tax=Caenorhabditis nigoni TaxID=1611254 RepID=A0A2G5TVF0_9PELO|nr:hypothetical protein B9Z55_012036 [Caenorhabditis nigoni]